MDAIGEVRFHIKCPDRKTSGFRPVRQPSGWATGVGVRRTLKEQEGQVQEEDDPRDDQGARPGERRSSANDCAGLIRAPALS